MEVQIPDYVIFDSMIHIKNEAQTQTLCGRSLSGVIAEPKSATGGFCLRCQEEHQTPGIDLSLVDE